MAEDPLIHNLGYVADERDELTVDKMIIRADNGYRVGISYSPDEDTIYSTTPRSQSMRKHWNDTRGNDVDEEAAAEWRKEGHQQIRERFEALFKNKSTTVEI